jgi:phosphodiesterase/alkaline phosphatase D-like protein
MRPVSPCGHRASRLPAKPAGYPLTQGDLRHRLVLGDQQAHWLANALDRSTATWKIVQADMPIG